MSEPEARVHVEAVNWMANSVAFYQPRADLESVKARLRAIALAACLAEVPGERGQHAGDSGRKVASRRSTRQRTA